MRPQLSPLGLLLVLSAPALSAPPDAAGIEFFEKKIRPVLVEHCYECHSAEAKKGLKGGPGPRQPRGVAQGGRSRAGRGAGQAGREPADQGRPLRRRRAEDAPQGEAARRGDRRPGAWVAMGAPDPRGEAAASPGGRRRGRRSSGAAAAGGACSRSRRPAVPQVKDAGWSAHPVDRFLLARLERAGLTPAEPADPRTLIRRLEPGADRPAADRRTRSRPSCATSRPRAYERAGRPAAGLAAFRRALGAALAGRRPVLRDARQRVELRGPPRLALPRLPHPGLQRRRALRPVRPRAHRRRPAAGAALDPRRAVQRVGHRHGLLSLRRGQPRRLHRASARSATTWPTTRSTR